MILKPPLEAFNPSNGFELLGGLGELGFELSSARSRICNKGSSVDFVFPGLPRSGVVRAVLEKDWWEDTVEPKEIIVSAVCDGDERGGRSILLKGHRVPKIIHR